MISRTVKRILLVVGAIIFLFVIALVLGFFWQFTKDSKESQQREIANQEKGKQFGKTTDQLGCMNEGLKRAQQFGVFDISLIVENEMFVHGCLRSSRATPGFCDSVPSEAKNFISDWQEKRCDRIDLPHSICTGLTQQQISFCDHQ